MSLRSDPFTNLLRLQSELGRAFGPPVLRDAPSRATAWVPPVDVLEDAEKLVFCVDVPDVNKEDLAVKVENGVLTIEGHRKLEVEGTQGQYHRVERAHGRFARSFALPESISSEKVEASLKDGVLRVTLAKRGEAKPRTIPIATA